MAQNKPMVSRPPPQVNPGVATGGGGNGGKGNGGNNISDKAKERAKKQKYIADQSQATIDAQNQMIGLAGGNTGWQDTAQNAVNGITSGAAFGSEDEDVMRKLMGGVEFGTNKAEAGIANFANGGMSGQQQGMGTLQQGANFNNAAGGLQQQQAAQLANSYNPAQTMLSGTASGQFLNGSPYLQSMINNANSEMLTQFKDAVNPGLNSQASMAGRNGSGAAALLRNKAEDTLAKNMTMNATNMIGANYDAERNRQEAATAQYGNFYNSDMQNRLNANSALAGTSAQQQGIRNDSANALNSANQFDQNMRFNALGQQQGQYNQDIQNQLNNANMQMNAANSYSANQRGDAQTQLQGAGMAGGMRALDYQDAGMLAGVGAQQDARKQAELQAQIQKWTANQNKDYNQIAGTMGILNGTGFNTQTQPVYSSGIGGALGGVGSLLGGIAAFSDERLKTDVKKVGEHPSGFDMYEYRYKGDPSGKRYVSPMAQDVEKVDPTAVFEINGLKALRNRSLAA